MIWLVYDATGVIPILTRSARNPPQALVSVASNKSKGRPAHSKYNLCGLAAGGQRIEYGSLSGLTCPCAAAEIPRQNDNARKNSVAARHTQTKIRKPNIEVRRFKPDNRNPKLKVRHHQIVKLLTAHYSVFASAAGTPPRQPKRSRQARATTGDAGEKTPQ